MKTPALAGFVGNTVICAFFRLFSSAPGGAPCFARILQQVISFWEPTCPVLVLPGLHAKVVSTAALLRRDGFPRVNIGYMQIDEFAKGLEAGEGLFVASPGFARVSA